MKKPLIIALFGFGFLVLTFLLVNILNAPQKTTQLAVKETLKDCGSNIDKEGATPDEVTVGLACPESHLGPSLPTAWSGHSRHRWLAFCTTMTS